MAQFVSNCNSKSDREGLLQSLQKHIKVDVFGGCGTLKCDPRTPEECHQMLNRSYKFYLSLENSVCQVGWLILLQTPAGAATMTSFPRYSNTYHVLVHMI